MADEFVSLLLPVGVVVVLLGALAAWRRAWVTGALTLQIVGGACMAGGAIAILVTGQSIGEGFHNSLSPAFGVDGLSAFFVAVIGLTSIPALIYATDTLPQNDHARPLTILSGLFLLALIGVLAARDAISFLAFWELLTVIPAAAILVARPDAEARRAVFIYIALTHVAGVGVWVAMLVLAQNGALGGALEASQTRNLVMNAALIGFGAKAGLMPLHSWLIRAHPLAPAHISALMSGVMIKVALYGLIRVLFEWTAPAPLWIGLVVLVVGAISALGGVLYALVQRELKRLLAFSSIENVGIIALALGAALVLNHEGESYWGAIAFAAALLHIANHAAFKSLLFLGAGSIGHAVGALDLDRLGGLLKRMPRTGWPFLIGCTAIAGVPPLNGFVSEWLTLQALLHVGYSEGDGISVAGALTASALAATAAISLYCFVKVAGMVLLGPPRTPAVATAMEQSGKRWFPLALLAGVCVVLGAVPALLLPTLVALAPGTTTLHADVNLSLPGTGSLPTLILLVTIGALALLGMRITRTGRRQARTPAWAGGQIIERSLDWSSASFTKPMLLVMQGVFRPKRELTIVEQPGLVQEIEYSSNVPHLFDTMIYAPLHGAAMRTAKLARRTQSGSVRTYIGYLLGLVIGMLAMVRLGLIG